MIHKEILDTIHKQISEGETGRALETFIQYLESASLHPEILRSLRVIQAGYFDVKRKESNGILPYSEARTEYARVNDAVLAMLEELISGKPSKSTQSRQWSPARILSLAGLIILVALTSWWIIKEQQQSGSGIQCPIFKQKSKRVMVLAFQRLSGDDSRPELSIQTRIQDLTEKNNLNTDVQLITGGMAEANQPGNGQEGAELGKKCQADLVIWGQYEKFQDSISVDIRYAFADEHWPAGIASTTFKNVSEIKFDQMKISNLDEAVLRLCTALALHENRMDLAKKWLLKQPNPTEREKGWIDQLKNTKN
ncbi:MAG: hypothetical protein IT261_14170 [Saprospiraceae bacterium]|nr:hypothetical protein [Saprospiraceae bacterium]